jgi:hypothetical protein
MALKIKRKQPKGVNVRMHGGKPGYSHVVTVNGPGKTIYIAGKLARDIDGNIVGPRDMRAARTDVQESHRLPRSRRSDLGRCRQDKHLCHRLRGILEAPRSADAPFRGRRADQHDDPDQPPRPTGGDGRNRDDRGRRVGGRNTLTRAEPL